MKFNKIVYTFACLALISCRNETSVVQTPVAQVPYVETTSYDVKVNDYVPVFDKLPSRTLENVEKFNLETPLRCEVDWETQQLISTQPFDRRDFLLERVDKGDALPDLKVENLSFENNIN